MLIVSVLLKIIPDHSYVGSDLTSDPQKDSKYQPMQLQALLPSLF